MTSYFSEVLRQLMQQNGLKASDFCSLLHISKSYFSKIKNGTAVPQDFAMAEEIAEIMQLNPEERGRLLSAYKISRFGPGYRQIEVAMQAVAEAQPFPPEDVPMVRIPLANGEMVRGKAAVLQAVRQLLHPSAVGEEVLLSFQPEDADLMRTVQNAVAMLPAAIPCKWQIFLHARQGTLDSAENAVLFSRCLPLLLLCRLEVRYQYAKLDEFFLHQEFPYHFYNGKELLLITQNCTAAVYFQDTAMVELYGETFRRTLEQSELFCAAYQDLETFFQSNTGDLSEGNLYRAPEIYVMGKNPCIIAGIDPEEIARHLTGDAASSQKLAEQYYALLRNLVRSTSVQHLFFLESGLMELMEAEEYYEFAPHVTKSISKSVRYHLLQNVIDMAKASSYLHFHMLRVPVLSFRTMQFLNLTSDGKGLFAFLLGERFVILTMEEKSITSAMIAFLRYLQESGMALGRTDSMKQIREVFARYAEPDCLEEVEDV